MWLNYLWGFCVNLRFGIIVLHDIYTDSGEALPAAVMDQFSHIPLARHSEPTSGVLYRQLVARLIHTRHGDTPHR